MNNKERDIQLTEISISHSSKTDMYIPEKYRCMCNNNLSTKKGQNCQMFKIISVAVIPIVFLIGQSLVSIMNDVESLAQHKSVRGDISFSVDIGFLVHLLQLERGTTALYISSGGSDIVFTNLEAKRLNTDIALNSLGDWLTLTSPIHFRSRDVFRVHLQDYRDGLHPLNTTIQAAIKFYSDDNEIIIDWVGLTVKDSQSESTWQLLTAYHMLLLSKEQAGIERAIGTTFFAGGLHA